MGYDLGAGYGGGYGGGCGCGVSPVAAAPVAVSPVSTGCGGFTTVGVILVLFILLVIVSRAFI
ncbi:sporulation protein YjcZ [Paenibacillus sp. MBLB4367]|uniref:sporulation protein YjcZ n=1 Tax=Paenibacillus sp. MBLB4367 TaxID=3384767 RepID=UPI003907F68F